MDNSPIGIFDSGVGGLTAMEELVHCLPGERYIYLGDSHNMPYGEKTPEQIVEMSRRNVQFLLEKSVKAIFIACGTATVNALQVLAPTCPVPVFGVVEAAVSEALSLTQNGRIGVLATRASIEAQTYQRRILQKAPNTVIEARACYVFATMVEYGIYDKNDPRVRTAADEYLPPLKAAGVDTVILGCTHYPLLSEVIREYVGEDVKLVSSGAAAARSWAKFIETSRLRAHGTETSLEYYTTGDKQTFAGSARHMLRRDISAQLKTIEPLYESL